MVSSGNGSRLFNTLTSRLRGATSGFASEVSPRGRSVRPDIEGLRGVAVLAVLGYHAVLPGFSGGYVGVDIFFVLSGFLITAMLIREREETGTISLLDFYVRRVRRLLPAATVVLIATLAATRVVAGRLDLVRTSEDVPAVALFAANFRFASETDYFAPSAIPSPFQHYWSLAMEEQFYFVWPTLCLLALLGRGATGRRILVMLCVLVPVSFVWSVLTIESAPEQAFFLLPARAWELGLGALVLFVPNHRVISLLRTPLALLGALLIAVAVVTFDETTPFPGWAALLPVVGTALLLLVGQSTQADGPSVVRWLSSRGLQTLGKYSYSLYLWHWPVIIVAAMRWPSVFTSWPKALLFTLLSVPLAIGTYHLVEDPIRRARTLVRSPRRSLLLAGGLVSASLVVGLAGMHLPRLDSGRPTSAASAAASDYVPNDLRPSLADADEDLPPIYEVEDCDTDLTSTSPDACHFGDRSSETVVALFGDSHAAMWSTPLRNLATAQSWRLDAYVTKGCSIRLADVPDCQAWRRNVLDELRQDPPNLVVLGDYGLGLTDPGDSPLIWAERVLAELQALSESSTVLVGATPKLPESAPDCLSGHLVEVRACEADPYNQRQHDFLETQRRTATRAGASHLDVTSLVCSADRCPAITGGRLVYRDADHLTETYVQVIGERFIEQLLKIVEPGLRRAESGEATSP